MQGTKDSTRALEGKAWLTLCFCALFMLIEGLDLASMPLAVPRVSEAWQVPPPDFALSLSAIVIGVGFAAVALAPLGEKFGRRRMIFWSGLIAALASGATAAAPNMATLVFWRFLTGVGLGACLPNVTTCVVQIAPVASRSRILAVVNTAIPVGGVLAGFLVAPLIRIGNWQTMFFVIAGLTVICSVALRLLLPASNGGTAPQHRPDAQVEKLPLLRLFEREHVLKTLLLIGLGTANTFLIYMLINWLPTLLPRTGMSLDQAARMSGLFQLGGIIGGFGFAYMIDKGRAVKAFMLSYALAILALATMLLPAMAETAWIANILALGFGISGAHVAITLFGVMFYPQSMLSSYVGLSIAVTRIGAIAGPLAGGWLLGVDQGIGAYLVCTVMAVVVCLLWVLAIGRFCTPGKTSVSQTVNA